MINTGNKIRINKGQVETLIKIDGSLGLFRANGYQVIRRLSVINTTHEKKIN